ncbi:MAG: galactokinase family protein, partial [Bacillota bacterium]|nr:galactokinase family protein [Bacillota bacterium]
MKYKITAPGRVNLIGEHTDYNGGFVLPMAIDLSLTMFGSKKEGRLIHVTADDCGENEVFSLDRIERKGVNPSWVDYIKGVCRVLEQNNYRLTGAELAFSGSIPIGAGLSSSAALELATASILSRLSGYNISLVKLAMMCQEAENDFVGVQCGIMDQFSVALSRKGHALFLDCQTLDYEYVPLELGEHVIMIIDSRVKRALA